MARLSLKFAGYPWDHITPLLTGDVVPEGIDLLYDVHHGLEPVTDDTACAGGEASLGRFMIDTARGNHDFVGLPIFPMFAFRHRCFLVKRGTAIGDLSALEGKRVGLDGWPNSGNTWTRVMLRQTGVDIWKITALATDRACGGGSHLRRRLAALWSGAESQDADGLLPGSIRAEAGGRACRSDGHIRRLQTLPLVTASACRDTVIAG